MRCGRATKTAYLRRSHLLLPLLDTAQCHRIVHLRVGIHGRLATVTLRDLHRVRPVRIGWRVHLVALMRVLGMGLLFMWWIALVMSMLHGRRSLLLLSRWRWMLLGVRLWRRRRRVVSVAFAVGEGVLPSGIVVRRVLVLVLDGRAGRRRTLGELRFDVDSRHRRRRRRRRMALLVGYGRRSMVGTLVTWRWWDRSSLDRTLL